ncbi:3-oxoacyl-[acyl-carrier-protein] reductase FabG-like [Dermatophagoides pteronyssinus]|uniref:3-oxoacyl-[acyl-carrier-protein] reductase FabG-like n=1 Tax=Dermatophagoides pteronyssinus TaxID=6956 RepID=UPI003F6695C7
MSQTYDFDGKVAIVTGSSSGLGEAIVCMLAKYGCRVTVHGRSEENVNRVAAKCHELSPKKYTPNICIGDLMDDQVIEKIVQTTVESFGQIDFLINNAGGHYQADFSNPNEVLKSYDFTFGLNVRSTLYLTSLAIPYLEKSKGVIVIISSIGSFSSFNNEKTIIYEMSKAALDHMVHGMALSYGRRGIRINTINPGPFKTAIYRNYSDQNEYEKELKSYEQISPLGRYGEPEELANLVIYLVSTNSSYITGTNIVIDGGSSIPRFI